MPGRSKGFSFGTSPRNNFMPINLVSPAAKYNIKGTVEINLDKKKGPSFGSSRVQSVEKTPLSYVCNNINVTHFLCSLGLEPTTAANCTNRTLRWELASKITNLSGLSFWMRSRSMPTLDLEPISPKLSNWKEANFPPILEDSSAKTNKTSQALVPTIWHRFQTWQARRLKSHSKARNIEMIMHSYIKIIYKCPTQDQFWE